MALAFVHLSDIHFGQEKGSDVIIHDDVKDCLIDDAVAQVAEHVQGPITGIIVTGDVAFAGKIEEYTKAGEWLDKLAAELGCKKTAVQMVPGNHDIDRDGISSGCKLMLDEILAEGEPKLDRYLAAELDRESLHGRFRHYRPFAEGYNCPLDPHGRFASDRAFDLAPGRKLRFVGLNSALICTANDLEGRLLLGARQRVLPRPAAGEEIVVLCHHPLNWFMDSEDAQRLGFVLGRKPMAKQMRAKLREIKEEHMAIRHEGAERQGPWLCQFLRGWPEECSSWGRAGRALHYERQGLKPSVHVPKGRL
jgi:hypothetical protein